MFEVFPFDLASWQQCQEYKVHLYWIELTSIVYNDDLEWSGVNWNIHNWDLKPMIPILDITELRKYLLVGIFRTANFTRNCSVENVSGSEIWYLLVIVVFLDGQDCRASYFPPFCLVSRTFSCNFLGQKYNSRQFWKFALPHTNTFCIA